MNKGIFIIGTDTDVGKTVVSAGLIRALKKRGTNVTVLKPIASGCEKRGSGLYSEDAAFLAAAAEIENDKEVTPFRYAMPLAPHVAATLEGPAIDVDLLKETCKAHIDNNEFTVVEGIGGLMVPLAANYYVMELIRDCALPVIIVARINLGTINHTLLTIEVLQKYNLAIKGIVFNTLEDKEKTQSEKTNPAVIHELSGVPVLGVLPYINDLDMKHREFGSLVEVFEECITIEGLGCGV